MGMADRSSASRQTAHPLPGSGTRWLSARSLVTTATGSQRGLRLAFAGPSLGRRRAGRSQASADTSTAGQNDEQCEQPGTRRD
jgi:hypothetical protein